MAIKKGLADILLQEVRQRPAMYLGDATISNLAIFITGYNVGFNAARKENEELDEYFGENGFVEWFERKYNIQRQSFWQIPFLKKANNDEKEALTVFFKFLEEYQSENKGCESQPLL